MGQISCDSVLGPFHRVLSRLESQPWAPWILYLDGRAKLEAIRWSLQRSKPRRRTLPLCFQLPSGPPHTRVTGMALAETYPWEARAWLQIKSSQDSRLQSVWACKDPRAGDDRVRAHPCPLPLHEGFRQCQGRRHGQLTWVNCLAWSWCTWELRGQVCRCLGHKRKRLAKEVYASNSDGPDCQFDYTRSFLKILPHLVLPDVRGPSRWSQGYGCIGMLSHRKIVLSQPSANLHVYATNKGV